MATTTQIGTALPPPFPGGAWTLGRHVAWRLVQIGVTDAFSVPDDFNLALLDHLIAEPGLNFVGCCNELKAGYATDVYVRARGIDACRFERSSLLEMLKERRRLLAYFYRYASISVGNVFLTRLGRVSIALMRKKRQFAVLGGIRHPYARFLQLRSWQPCFQFLLPADLAVVIL
ncbi:thiamine pyrophosphate dependent pyruvate decarboxylase family protein [Actinidia rufa]|uniref:pyruvate decarboxylase n=1 Tax=Actinidia rufa TaxID=165716 RepID=A0A7J0ER91_9ERIC|nr:thiamine pyrophosphate dependent pyruvate decarboxylase family protein [Actinidia rufa]